MARNRRVERRPGDAGHRSLAGKPDHQKQSHEPDYAAIRHELQTNKHVTIQLLWEEYREKDPDGYRYSRYVTAAFVLRNDLKAMTDARSVDIDAT